MFEVGMTNEKTTLQVEAALEAIGKAQALIDQAARELQHVAWLRREWRWATHEYQQLKELWYAIAKGNDDGADG
jgi:hypothetical protein